MAITQGKVSTYQVNAYAGQGVQATIVLEFPEGSASLHFYGEGDTLPNNLIKTDIPGKLIFHVYYHYYQLVNIIDILRNEKPVSFFFNHDNMYAYLFTGPEPVGEGFEP